jgi:hypothetical protein
VPGVKLKMIIWRGPSDHASFLGLFNATMEFFFQCKNFLTAFSVRSNAKGGGRLWLLLASSVTRLSEISPFGKKYFSIFAYFRTIFVLF